MKTSLLGVVAVSLLAVACSNAEDDGDIDEGAVEIQPVGNDTPGKLTLVAPGTVETTTFNVGGVSAALGATIGDLRVGGVEFQTTTSGGNYGFRSHGSATITSGQTTTVKAASLAIKAVGGPRTLGLEGDVTNWGIRLAKTPDPRYGMTGNRSEGGVKPTTDGTASAPVLGAEYEVNYGVGAIDGVAFKIAEGETKSVVLSDTQTRLVTRVKAPPARALPDANCGRGEPRALKISVPPASYQEQLASADVKLADGETIEVGLSAKNKDRKYQVGNSNWRDTVPLPKAQAGAPIKWELGRIDVHDVKVNGTQTVKGTYRIFVGGTAVGQPFLACDPPTETGVDLPPGTYAVQIRYSTTEAGEKIDTHVVTVPP